MTPKAERSYEVPGIDLDGNPTTFTILIDESTAEEPKEEESDGSEAERRD